MSRRRCSINALNGPHRRPAFALAAIIVCLVLVSVALVGMARLSLNMAAETSRIKRDFQLRWGARSCRSTLLQVAPELFDRLEKRAIEEERPGPAPSALRFRFLLGRSRVDLRLRDDSAALDLNTAYHYVGRSRLESSLRRVIGPKGSRLVRLQPEAKSTGKPDVRRLDEVRPIAFQGWGEVFQIERMGNASARARLGGLTAMMTCSADTGLNVRRAPDRVIEETCRLVVSSSEAKNIVESCREQPRPHVHRILEQLGIDRRDQVLLKELLTEQSTCYSIWIEARDANRRRFSSAVVRYHDDGTYGVSSFCY